MAAVFVVITASGVDSTLAGYAQAAAEASLVGGLADWFAVTALFRRPLGLPIPHTAIVVERKDQFAQTLGEFVQESFLTPEAIVERIHSARMVDRAATWLAEPANANRLAGNITGLAVDLTGMLNDDDVHRVLEDLARERLESIELAPLAGRALRFLTQDGRHDEVLDSALRGLDTYLDTHKDELRARLGNESPWWLPGAVEDRIFERLLDGARAVIGAMAADPSHPMRRELDERLAKLATDLATSPDLRAKGEDLKRKLLSEPQLRQWVTVIWADVKAELRTQASAPESALRQRMGAGLASAGRRVQEDPALRAVVDESLEKGVRYVAERFDGEIATLISGTIARWDAQETARRLELLLGPDLQYIRINGTVVGGLAGIALHALANALA